MSYCRIKVKKLNVVYFFDNLMGYNCLKYNFFGDDRFIFIFIVGDIECYVGVTYALF